MLQKGEFPTVMDYGVRTAYPNCQGNKERDRWAEATLRQLGWDVLVVGEYDLHYLTRLESRLSAFLAQVELNCRL